MQKLQTLLSHYYSDLLRSCSGVQTRTTTSNDVRTFSASWKGYNPLDFVNTKETIRYVRNARAWPEPWKEDLCKQSKLCCATLERSRSKRNVGSCWLKILTSFKFWAATPISTQQHATGCANGRNMQNPTVSGVVCQQCCVCLDRATAILHTANKF